MTTELASYHNHLVARDSVKTWRWFDVFGPNATKWELNPNMFPLASTTTAAGYTVTNVNGTLVFVAGADGGAITFTVAGADNDGIQIQPVTEGFKFASAWPAYFGCKFSVVDADQNDVFIGLSISDSTAAGATVSDCIGFASVDESASLTFNTIKDSVASSVVAATLVDATAITAEFFYDGTNVTAYVNGTAAGVLSGAASTFPNDEYLTPLLAVLTGEATANNMVVYWARALQIRE